ncbi:hypothetical protein NECAME_00862 [Necator americanus]|uniref:Uncharacterized protein n=1 Tax=Necator americanus TaxID=51031 RepID=W2SNQ4_NECAM|nr:hypothetical protein NECAME_00862 [Necator americanus]ETN71173.1 hypothetical protein NECAME_00862 [Necator americanus]
MDLVQKMSFPDFPIIFDYVNSLLVEYQGLSSM